MLLCYNKYANGRDGSAVPGRFSSLSSEVQNLHHVTLGHGQGKNSSEVNPTPQKYIDKMPIWGRFSLVVVIVRAGTGTAGMPSVL